MLVLVSFVGAYFLLKPKPYYEYNNMKVYPIKYENSNLMFYSIPLNFNVQGQTIEKNIVLRSDPMAIENISYDLNESVFNMAVLGITMDPSYNIKAGFAAQEISKLSQTLNIKTVLGGTKSDEEGKITTIFDCENSTELVRIIRLELGNETKIAGNGNCTIISGENYDKMIEAADKFVVEWLKLIVK
jgi:hypothetical protein